MMKRILLVIGVIFLLVGCSDSSYDKYNDDGTISYMYAEELIINNEAMIIDVRDEEDYNEEHIEGAININMDSISEDVVSNSVNEMDSYIIVYGDDNDTSEEAVDKLMEIGYVNVYNLGTIDNWGE